MASAVFEAWRDVKSYALHKANQADQSRQLKQSGRSPVAQLLDNVRRYGLSQSIFAFVPGLPIKENPPLDQRRSREIYNSMAWDAPRAHQANRPAAPTATPKPEGAMIK